MLRCAVCLQPVPPTLKQDHHEIPQAAGGRNGPVVKLCAGCHHDTHRIADMLTRGKAGLAEDSARIAFPDDAVRRRMFGLARTVAEYMQMKRDGIVSLTQPVTVMIELPVEIKLAAQQMANDVRDRGRPVGLARWIASLVKREVWARHPSLRPPLP